MKPLYQLLAYKSWKTFGQTYGILLSLLIFGFLIRMVKFDLLGWSLQVILTGVQFAGIVTIWESLRYINRRLDKTLPYEKSLSKRMATQMIYGGVVGLLIRAIIYTFGEPYLPFKLDDLFVATTWALFIAFPATINLGFFTVYFIDRWKEGLIKNERLEKEKSQVQFDNLKNQMNPHFLFNALTSLNSLIFENQQLASEFLQQLAKVYRYVLQNKDRNFVSLQTEIDFIRHYVQLLETRFESALTIRFDVSLESRERAVVPVTLQILIENALKHNVVDRRQPLSIEIVTLGDYLVVTNNLQPRKLVETSNKVGLENLKTLYRFLTDKPVLIEKTDERFAVKVPLV